MIVTGAFFADYARQAEQKLDVLGGVWDWCVLPSLAHPVEAYLVVLLQQGSDDTEGRVSVEIGDSGEDGPLHAFEIPVAANREGAQQAVALPISFTCRRVGRHVLRLSTGASDPGFVLSLDVRAMA